MSEQEAEKEFYGHFVNTQGRPGCCIPADLQMEYIVKKIKKNIKHMQAGQSIHHIHTKTRAISGIESIANNFDAAANVVQRATKHSHRETAAEEVDMINDLLEVRPFQHQPGRNYEKFPNMEPSLLHRLDNTAISTAKWLKQKIELFATEITQ
jgi:TusA-related sulfurtransferase